MNKRCENCGCILEKWGCPSCDEKDVNDYYDYLSKCNEKEDKEVTQ